MSCAKVAVGSAALTLLAGLVFTQETVQDKLPTGKAGPPAGGTKPASYKVEKKPFRIELTVKGILEAEHTTEIAYRPLAGAQGFPGQGPLTVRKIVEHGATVKKGDVLVAFDTLKINEIIEDLEKDKKVLEASIKLAEEELPLLQKSAPVDLTILGAAKQRADEELKYFLEVGRPQAVKQADKLLNDRKFSMESAQEDLRQLEKMYKSNDLTEETEKIILRRQQHTVASAVFFYQAGLLDHDVTLKQTLPNKEKSLKETQIKLELQLEKSHKTLAPMLSQKQAALAQMRHNLHKSTSRLEKILKDRAAMTMESPEDGVVYYGKFQKGSWTVSDALINKLVPGGNVLPEEVFLTVLKPSPVVMHVTFDEKDAGALKAGLQGKARLTINPDRQLPAKVARLSPVPTTPGKYSARVAFDGADANLMPGMGCTVKFTPYSKPDALVVPIKTVHEDGDKYVVYMAAKNGKEDRREVTRGYSDGDYVEILSGLAEGEEVLVERPSPKASAK